MGKGTDIEWATHTFNAWWGCAKVSDACKFCYAEMLAKRWGWDIWGPTAERRFFKPEHFREPLTWQRDAAEAGVVERVFCSSMADIFEIHPDPEINAKMNAAREQVWWLVARTPNLIWLFLTKRPENAWLLVPSEWDDESPQNAWMGVTAENQ